MRNLKTKSVVILLCLAMLQAGCWWSDDAQSRFAQANFELSNGLRTGAETLRDLREIDPRKAEVLAAWAQRMLIPTRAQRAYLLELQKYVDLSGKLVLDAEGQRKLNVHLQALSAAALTVVRDPDLVRLDPMIAQQLETILAIVPVAVSKLLELLNRMPKAKNNAPPLQQQLKLGIQSEIATIVDGLAETENILTGVNQ